MTSSQSFVRLFEDASQGLVCREQRSGCVLCRTLFSNQALCVNADFVYLKVKDPATGRCYIVAETRLAELPGAVLKPKKGQEDTKSAPTIVFQVHSHICRLPGFSPAVD